MLLPESLPIFYSVGLVVAVSATVFAWRFYVFRKNLLNSLYSLPSVLVTGAKLSGKTSLIKAIAESETSSHPFEYTLQLAYLKNGNQTLQFIEIPSFTDGRVENLSRLKKLNLRSVIYVFDVSDAAIPIESQIENFENIKKIFYEIPIITVANKIDVAEKDKVEKLKNRFEKIYEVSAIMKGKTEDSLLLKKEFYDLTRLVQDLSQEVAAQKEVVVDST